MFIDVYAALAQAVEAALAEKAPPEMKDQALCDAATSNDAALTKRLLDAKADVASKNADGKTAFELASAPEIKALIALAEKAPPEMKDQALCAVATSGDTEVAKRLVEHMADVNAMDPDGQTPLDLAKAAGDASMRVLLMDHGGATSEDRYIRLYTPMHVYIGVYRPRTGRYAYTRPCIRI